MSRLIERGLSSAQAARVVLTGVDEAAVRPTPGQGWVDDGPPRDPAIGPNRELPVAATLRSAPPLASKPVNVASTADLSAVADVANGDGDRVLGRLEQSRELLITCLYGYDDAGANAVLDQLLAQFSLEAVLRDVILPMLREQGERWRRGEITIVQEHFATNVVRGRLAGLARGWAGGTGPRAVVACPSGEQHDLASMMFGIVLHHCGWRVIFLGANTPLDQLTASIDPAPDLVVVSVIDAQLLRATSTDIAALSAWAPVAIAGRGASSEAASAMGAFYLVGDPVTEALNVAAGRYATQMATGPDGGAQR